MSSDRDQELLNKLSAGLERLDAQYDDISPPSLPAMEQFLVAEALHRRRQNRKELLLFWLAGLFLLSIILAVLSSAPVVYWILQGAIPLAVLGSYAAVQIRLRWEDREQ
jgi:4-amino-4-deoxy-L-arabinose transferase-like glycosyltransferase